jgi:hypothetical protein
MRKCHESWASVIKAEKSVATVKTVLESVVKADKV